MACTTGCPNPGTHESWGACLKSKSLRAAVSIPGKNWDRSAQSSWDRRIDSYKSARADGIQPSSTRSSDIDHAIRHSDQTGTAFQGA